MYQRMMTGPEAGARRARCATSRCARSSVVAPLIAAFLVLGFYPKPALDMLNPAVAKTLQHVGVTDPAPTSAADGSTK